MWILFTISKPQEYTVSANVFFKNVPEDKSLFFKKSWKVLLRIEGTGWELLSAQVKKQNYLLSINLRGNVNKNFIILSTYLPDLNSQLHTGRVSAVFPDTIRFDQKGPVIKRVPLKVHYSISFASQFSLLGGVMIAPDSVQLAGPSYALDRIKFWETGPVVLKEVKSSLDTALNLTSDRYPDVSVAPGKAAIRFEVDRFTESVISIPIIVLNNAQNAETQLMPSRVKISYMVPLQWYGRVKEPLFQATVDLKEWTIGKKSKLLVNVAKSPNFIKIKKITPSSIDFLILKR